MADYLIADTAAPEQLLNDANLWLDQALALLHLAAPVWTRSGEVELWADAARLTAGIEGLERLLLMVQGCIVQAHRRLLQQQLESMAV